MFCVRGEKIRAEPGVSNKIPREEITKKKGMMAFACQPECPRRAHLQLVNVAQDANLSRACPQPDPLRSLHKSQEIKTKPSNLFQTLFRLWGSSITGLQIFIFLVIFVFLMESGVSVSARLGR